MSNLSDGSTSRRLFFTEIPRRCWCGSGVRVQMSNSERNPHRRYYRCVYAVNEKLGGDDHVFKWVDEAILNEIERMDFRLTQIERTISNLQTMDDEAMAVKVKYFVEQEIEASIKESEYKMKKFVGCAVIGVASIVVGLWLL